MLSGVTEDVWSRMRRLSNRWASLLWKNRCDPQRNQRTVHRRFHALNLHWSLSATGYCSGEFSRSCCCSRTCCSSSPPRASYRAACPARKWRPNLPDCHIWQPRLRPRIVAPTIKRKAPGEPAPELLVLSPKWPADYSTRLPPHRLSTRRRCSVQNSLEQLFHHG